tara:strand:- start:506 stop:1051 length:546 start_codon:yes stop_codon:yes gene_type:complete
LRKGNFGLWNYYSKLDPEELKRSRNYMLYCAAKIDENNVVVDTIVVDDTTIRDGDGNISDELTTSFANTIRETTGTWKAAGMYQEGTAPDFRNIEPGVGDNWHPGQEKFYQKKPQPSWILQENLNWEPPTARPNSTTKWIWNEETQTWELPEQNFEVSTNYYTETGGNDPDNDNYVGRSVD